MTYTLLKSIPLLCTVASLNACGSATTGSALQIHDIGITFNGNVKEISHSNTTGASLSADNHPFSITQNANGGFDISLNGEPIVFTEDNLVLDAIFVKDISSSEQIGITTLSMVTNNKGKYKYSDLIFGFKNPNTNNKTIWYSAFGEDTIDMANAGTSATYTGSATALILEKDATNFGNEINGDISLTANFSTNSINGRIHKVGSLPGQVNIQNGTITNNQFVADLAGDSVLNA